MLWGELPNKPLMHGTHARATTPVIGMRFLFSAAASFASSATSNRSKRHDIKKARSRIREP
tara:strand:+ start:845 stop:1027 length:183 start_codon:yes stop_codon:yes gene_type:complete